MTVLRNGRRVGTWDAPALPRHALVAAMLGRELEAVEREHAPRRDAAAATDGGAPAIEAAGLCAGNGLNGVSLAARAGEVVGLAGLLGSGRTELCETLFGLVRRTAGRLAIGGREPRLKSPADAMREGIALCPEDRKAAGILGPLSIRENVVVALQARRGWWRPLGRREQRRLAEAAIRELAIACPGPEAAVETLSGGNQQRVILARWLNTSPRILLLDEPTRGIDVGAHAGIIRLIRSLCARGLCVIVASSEIEELVAFSDSVLVMRERASVALLADGDVTGPAIAGAIAGAA